MESKKLLKFLLKDLSELEELVAEKESDNFDEFEIEFIQARVSGAKRMIQILHDREISDEVKKYREREKAFQAQEKLEITTIQEEKVEKPIEIEERKPEKIEDTEVHKEIAEIDQLEEIPETKTEAEKVEMVEEIKENVSVEEKEDTAGIAEQNVDNASEETITQEKNMELEEEVEEKDNANRRLGDSFSKEKSVNDLIDVENTKLEHKLSNRPVQSIKSAIGINDRFQYIRELFDGNVNTFSKAVSELDSKNNIQEAVAYLQQNFKWKKNETSLKFVNLVKRRFLNE